MTKARDIASAIPAPSTVSSAELGYLDGVTSAIQTQVDAKIAKTLTTTTGDMIYASGANTPARLGIGSSAQVLTVASGVPSWATPASGSTFAGASVFPSADVSLTNNTYTRVLFNSETYDTDSYHSTSTNTGRMTIPSGKAGYYLFNFDAQCEGGTKQARLYKNGSAFGWIQTQADGANDFVYTAIHYGAVADYFEIYVKQSSGTTKVLFGTTDFNNFQISYLGA